MTGLPFPISHFYFRHHLGFQLVMQLFLLAWSVTAHWCSTIDEHQSTVDDFLDSIDDIWDGDHTFGLFCVLVISFLGLSLLTLLFVLMAQFGYPHSSIALKMHFIWPFFLSDSDTMSLHLSSYVLMTPSF